MKPTLKIKIECGEKTCASVPGEFCTFLRVDWPGHNPTCHFFGKKLEDTGWVMRCSECLEAAAVPVRRSLK